MAAPAQAEYRPGTIIAEPPERNPHAITRPATPADRAWRRGRKTPELATPSQTPAARRIEPPRYDAYGRRRNVPGRPDTLDAYGRTHRDLPGQGGVMTPSGPTVRTDAATRINQFPPPSRSLGVRP